MSVSSLFAGVAASIPLIVTSGIGVGVLVIPAKLRWDRFFYERGASSSEIMWLNAGVAALLATTIVIVLLCWLRHTCNTQLQHIRKIYAASDRIRNELQTLVYATAITVKDADKVKVMFKATQDIRKELEQMSPWPADPRPCGQAVRPEVDLEKMKAA